MVVTWVGGNFKVEERFWNGGSSFAGCERDRDEVSMFA